MKRLLVGSLLGCAALFVFSLSAPLRGDDPNRKVDVDVGRVHVDVNKNNTNSSDMGGKNVVRGKDLMGLNVYGENDEKLGDIKDLVIDPKEGKIRYAVLTFGGFLGMGDKFFAVPWSDIQFISKGTTSTGTVKEDYCTLSISKDELKNAPGFDKNNWPNFADQNWSSNVDKYYNEHRHTRRPTGTIR
jgi:sporulation protein YlmC with PRC-barrel domain